jgi:hypothetical protein
MDKDAPENTKGNEKLIPHNASDIDSIAGKLAAACPHRSDGEVLLSTAYTTRCAAVSRKLVVNYILRALGAVDDQKYCEETISEKFYEIIAAYRSKLKVLYNKPGRSEQSGPADPDDLIRTLTPPPKPARPADPDDSVRTLTPPPKPVGPDKKEETPEMTWDDISALTKDKINVWIKRNNGRWTIGRIMCFDKGSQRLTVTWSDPDSKLRYSSKTISFETFLQWEKDTPGILSKRPVDFDFEHDPLVIRKMMIDTNLS